MKLVTFIAGSEPRLGAKVGDQIVDLNLASTAYLAAKGETLPYQTAAATVPADLKTLLVKGERGLQAARDVLDHVADRQQAGKAIAGPQGERVVYPESEVRLKAPIAKPDKIVCIGLNYRDHCEEQNVPLPTAIRTFAVYPNAIVGPGENIIIPKTSVQVDWEAELVVVIGKRAKHVPVEQALGFVGGYTCGNDVSVRDHQKADAAVTRGKSADTHAPIGPWVVTRDEVPDSGSLDLELRVNGIVKQSSNTRNLVFNVAELVSFISSFFTLEPGDLIFTGTPGGVGAYRKPPEWLKPGDRVEITLAQIGTLTNSCVAEE